MSGTYARIAQHALMPVTSKQKNSASLHNTRLDIEVQQAAWR